MADETRCKFQNTVKISTQRKLTNCARKTLKFILIQETWLTNPALDGSELLKEKKKFLILKNLTTINYTLVFYTQSTEKNSR
jgi:hypothetical protein